MIRGYRLIIEMLENCISKDQPQIAEEELRCIFFTIYIFSENYSDYFKAIIEYETKDAEVQTGINDRFQGRMLLT
jgi:hypothetical protein